MTVAAMPDDWQPVCVDQVRFGKSVRLWHWKGHELACRQADNPIAWDAFRAETWAVKARLEAGETVIHYAHAKRHDPERRPVSTPEPIDQRPPATTDDD